MAHRHRPHSTPMHRCFTFPQASIPPPPRDRIPSSPGDLTAQSPTTLTFQEYSRATETPSYQEIWSTIHPNDSDSIPPLSPSSLLRPDGASISDALLRARPGHLTRHASDFFDHSELATRLCLSIQLSVDRARLLYAPLHSLLDVLPPLLSPDQSSAVFDVLLRFHASDNPFPPSDFDNIRRLFADLSPKLQSLLHDARRKRVLLRRVTDGATACLIAAVVGITITGFVIATHGLAALAMAPIAGLKLPRGRLERRRERARLKVRWLEDAVNGAYVHHLETIRCLEVALRGIVESDFAAAGVGVRQGRKRGAMEEVVKHLRKNQEAFVEDLVKLEEHICFCCTAINRSRSLVLEHVRLRSRCSS